MIFPPLKQICAASLALAACAWPVLVHASSFCSGVEGACPPSLRPFGQELRVTIGSRAPASTERAGELKTIGDVFAAIGRCWAPPDRRYAAHGTQISMRLSFKRNGEILGEPRITYISPGIPDQTKQLYAAAARETVRRCSPLPLSAGLGGALAGRPFAVRFVEDRPDLPGGSI